MTDKLQGWRLVKFFPKGWHEGVKEHDALMQLSFDGEEVSEWTVGEWSFLLANAIDLTKPPQKPKKVDGAELVGKVADVYDGHLIA